MSKNSFTVGSDQLGVVRSTLGEGNGTPLQYSCLENPWMEKPHGLQSMGSLRVGHNWATSLSLFTFMHWRRQWQPTPVFLPGESRDGEAWWAAVYRVAQSGTRLKRLSSSSSSRSTLSAGTRGKTYGKETGTKKNNCLIGFSSSDCLG